MCVIFWILFHDPLFSKYLFPGVALSVIIYKNLDLLTLHLLSRRLCSIIHKNMVVQTILLAEKNTSHVHITLY